MRAIDELRLEHPFTDKTIKLGVIARDC